MRAHAALLPLIEARANRIDALRNRIVCMDALAFLRSLPAGSVDLIVTSPPYNLLNSTGSGLKGGNSLWTNGAFRNGYDSYSDDLPREDYVNWQRGCLAEMMRVISDNGAIFYNHKWRIQNGLLEDQHEIVEGFPVRQIIIWSRGNGFNFNPGYFLPTFEVIYLIAKPDFRLRPGANAEYKDVWHILPTQNKKHPNAFPVELARRCIDAAGAKLVVDPFMGSGSTADAARIQGCDFMGCDISANSVEDAIARINTPYMVDMFAKAAGE